MVDRKTHLDGIMDSSFIFSLNSCKSNYLILKDSDEILSLILILAVNQSDVFVLRTLEFLLVFFAFVTSAICHCFLCVDE